MTCPCCTVFVPHCLGPGLRREGCAPSSRPRLTQSHGPWRRGQKQRALWSRRLSRTRKIKSMRVSSCTGTGAACHVRTCPVNVACTEHFQPLLNFQKTLRGGCCSSRFTGNKTETSQVSVMHVPRLMARQFRTWAQALRWRLRCFSDTCHRPAPLCSGE